MTPAAELIYSHDYAQRLYRGVKPFSEAWHDLVMNGEVFERVFHQAIGPVLQALPKVTGYDWLVHDLPIYAAADGPGLAKPLTLVITDDAETMLYDLIVQLARANMQTGFTSDQQRDLVLHAAACAVAQHVGLDLEDTIANAALLLREQYGADLALLDWAVPAKTIRSYLQTS